MKLSRRSSTLFAALLLTAACCAAAAPIAGTWEITSIDQDENPIRAILTIKEDAGKLTGSLTVQDLVLPVSEAKMDGDTFTCKLTAEERVYELKTKVSGSTIEGSWTSGSGRKGSLKGTRKTS